MVILPAIDLRDGKVVRLRQGRAEDETVFGDNPAEMARRWHSFGVEWLHLVDLDGAFEGASANVAAIRSVRAAVDMKIELGGGIRTIGHAEKFLSLGIDRVIFGTVAVSDPQVVRRAVERFGANRVVVGIDARDGRVAVRGWTETSAVDATNLALQMREFGVERVVYTDISRDGTGHGVNVEATANLAKTTALKIIASGGVRELDDVVRLIEHESDGIEGVIIGRALYDGTIELDKVLEIARKDTSLNDSDKE
jgi:phosphoribosylformimino-5-aminoimidazole carboxamide ribotide isomerase